MNYPGVYSLAALSLTGAITAEAQTPIASLDGMAAVTLAATLAYGSGGTSVAAVVQTSLDGGTTWLDVARFDFTTSSETRYLVVQAIAAKGVTSYAALASEGVNDGLLGDRLRVVVTSVGTYADTSLSVRASVR